MALSKIAADDILFFPLFFRENETWNFMWIVCPADDSHEMPNLIFSEKYEFKKSKCMLSPLRVKSGFQNGQISVKGGHSISVNSGKAIHLPNVYLNFSSRQLYTIACIRMSLFHIPWRLIYRFTCIKQASELSINRLYWLSHRCLLLDRLHCT